MALAAFLYCLTIGAAQGRVTSIENVDGRIWMCVSEGGRLLLSYSDGGAFSDALGDNIASVKLTFDETKFESYTIENGVLSASIAAENTAAVLGTDIGYDVDVMITTGEGRVISVVINYESDFGPVEAIISYN